jgi:hypothetical protein
VTALYVLNGIMVAIDMALVVRFRPPPEQA